MKAMILAAGLGTRLRPLTDDRPKALVEIGGMTMLEITIRFLKKHGISEIVVNVHHFADQITEYLDRKQGFGMKYQISDESSELMNTGGGLVKARPFLEDEENFVLIGVDVLTNLDLSEMIKIHTSNKMLVTLAVKERNTTRSLLFNEQMLLSGWCDNRTGKTIGITKSEAHAALGFSVVHILSSNIFDTIVEKGAFSIMELYLRLMHEHPIYGFRHDESGWLEFGRASEIKAQQSSHEFKRLISLL